MEKLNVRSSKKDLVSSSFWMYTINVPLSNWIRICDSTNLFWYTLITTKTANSSVMLMCHLLWYSTSSLTSLFRPIERSNPHLRRSSPWNWWPVPCVSVTSSQWLRVTTLSLAGRPEEYVALVGAISCGNVAGRFLNGQCNLPCGMKKLGKFECPKFILQLS